VNLRSDLPFRVDAISYLTLSGTLAWLASSQSKLVGIALFLALTLLPAIQKFAQLWGKAIQSMRQGAQRHSLELEKSHAKTARLNSTPQITVVIPVFNAETTLDQTVRSVLHSERVEVKVILVDDNSSDGSLNIARRIVAEDPRVRLIRSYQNLGPSFCRNVGLLHAETEFVTFLDADDIQSKDRLYEQAAPFARDATCQATLCLGARWDEKITARLEQPRPISISVMIRRKLVEQIGFFDSVRAGADTEFIQRLKAQFGSKSVITIKKELLFARLLPGSLTTTKSALRLWKLHSDGTATKVLSPVRSAYMADFKKWHQSSSALFVPFPMFERPFTLSHPSLSASPFLGQKVYGFMATFPDRSEAATIAVQSIAGQVDEIHVQANIFESAPEEFSWDAVHVHVSPWNDWQELGKFIHQRGKVGYLLTLDDDIKYPTDYAQRMVVEVELAARRAVVGVHGIIYSRDSPSAIHFRDLDPFAEAGLGRWVDALGTGTIAHHSDTVELYPSDFRSMGFADMWFAVKCSDQKIPLWSVQRSAGWLVPLDTPIESRLYTRKKAAAYATEELFKREFVTKIKPKPRQL
jgi:hypothetical protein